MKPGQLIKIMGMMGGAKIPWYLAGGVPKANCLGAYKAIGTVDIATSYINLANPGTYNLTTSDAPTFAAATGWTFNGTSNVLKTGWQSAAFANSIICRYSGLTADANRCPFGAYGTPRSFLIQFSSGGGGAFVAYNGNNVSSLAGGTTGVVAVSGAYAYFNAVQRTNTLTGSGVSSEVYIGNCNGVSQFFKGNIQAIAFYSIDITAYIIPLTNVMAALGG